MRHTGQAHGKGPRKLQTLRPRVGLANLQTAKAPPKTADKFYLSPEWIALRDRVRREAGGRCQAPGCGRIEQRMFVDHIIELKDGGAPLDRSNLWLLCGACHSLKTAAERARRIAERPGGRVG
jgi:5-methylcytosine-specific restriction protein A